MFKRNNITGHIRKRQWGAEKHAIPLPMIHAKPSTTKVTLSRLALVATAGIWFLYLLSTLFRQFFDGPGTYDFTVQAVSYLIVVTFLTFSASMYLLARQGALQRFSKHIRVPRAELERHFFKNRPGITMLIPSYSEEPDVVRKTMLSAALQEYPKKRIVLLIDDNPNQKNEAAAKKLDKTRLLGIEIMEILEEPRERFRRAALKFEKTAVSSSYASNAKIKELADHYSWAVIWLNKMAKNERVEDHVDRFFTDEVLLKLANDLDLTAKALYASINDNAKLSRSKASQLYRRLFWIFNAELDVFERKKYASMSHEANKAMNLNSYIGLMGGAYIKKATPDGDILVPAKNTANADIVIPDSEFLLTLDADSILLREYCLRLVYFLQQPDNSKVAVTQTPYSSFRGAATRIERLAGATTDIQHILHQGMSYYDATFWVGANAVIRKRALDDIAETEWLGGFEIKRYIQDRTVIEDTESSIDMAVKGWKLVNYPERLSYSATPPDFGSLIVQRRRWANGGLIIMPKLLSHIRGQKRRGQNIRLSEILLRTNYMSSIAWASFGLVFLLAFPYDGRLLSPLVVLSALPYFLAMASDLKYCGYKRTDVLRIYGFNLILLPVNLAGVLKSIQQALSSKKIPFARTPKVKNRTVSPLIYVTAPLLIIGFSIFTFWRDANAGNYGNAAFAAFNTVLAVYATAAYIGFKNTILDIWFGLTDWMYITVHPDKSEPKYANPSLDWRAVLYHGNATEAVPLAVSAYGNETKVTDIQKVDI